MHAGTGFYPGAMGGPPLSITTIVLAAAIVFLCFLIARWAINTFISGPSLPPPQEEFPAPAPFAAPPASPGAAGLATSLSALRAADPDFELETFLQRAEMTFYLVKSAFEKGDAAAGRPYLAPALFDGWSGEIASLHTAGKRVLFESLNVRGLRLVSAQHDATGDALAIHIDAVERCKVFTGAALVADDGDDLRFGELWHFARAAGLKTVLSGGVVAQKCPSCGAPLSLAENGACNHCGNVISTGGFDWTVTAVERTAFWGGAGGALDGAEVLGPEEGLAKLRAADPAFDGRAFLARVEKMFFALQTAWQTRDVNAAQTFLSPGCYFGWRSQLERMIAGRRRNVLEGLRVDAVAPVKVVHGRAFDDVTVRIAATCADYETDEGTGRIVFGDRTPRPFVEFWTFQRGVAAKTGAPGLDSKTCPNCGAPLSLNQIGQCTYCGAAVTSGQVDWVLSRIEEAEEYAAVAR